MTGTAPLRKSFLSNAKVKTGFRRRYSPNHKNKHLPLKCAAQTAEIPWAVLIQLHHITVILKRPVG